MVLKSPPRPEKVLVVDRNDDTLSSSEAESESELDQSYDNTIEDLKGQVGNRHADIPEFPPTSFGCLPIPNPPTNTVTAWSKETQ